MDGDSWQGLQEGLAASLEDRHLALAVRLAEASRAMLARYRGEERAARSRLLWAQARVDTNKGLI